MKSAVAVLTVALLHTAIAVTDEYMEKSVAAKQKCQKEFPVEKSEFLDFLEKRKAPESHNGKCMLACYMEEMKMMKDLKIDIEYSKETSKQKWNDTSIIEKANEVIDLCAKETSPEGKTKCDYAGDYAKCVVKNFQEKNIPAPDFLKRVRDPMDKH